MTAGRFALTHTPTMGDAPRRDDFASDAPGHEFGGSWTDDKLDRVRRYLEAYMLILRKHPALVPVYVDAFAGTGYRERPDSHDPSQLPLPTLGETESRFLQGSASLALGIAHPFGFYIFVERSKERARELERLRSESGTLSSRIKVVQQDANAFLQGWCATTNWSCTRAVVFLDPYGMQVEWQTIRCLAATESVDLWYLFPLGAVNRLLARSGRLDPAWIEKLDRIYGSHEWQGVFYPARQVQTLFGEEDMTRKSATFDRIADFTLERLRSEFPMVAPNPRVLYNDKNSPLFLLCFAVGSRKRSVQNAALKIASYILSM